MLHDVPAKTQNPLRNALNRRRAKAVAFAPVQYFEYYVESEGSDEEGEGESPVDEPEETEQAVKAEEEDTKLAKTETSTSTSTAAAKPSTTVQVAQSTQAAQTLKPVEDGNTGNFHFCVQGILTCIRCYGYPCQKE